MFPTERRTSSSTPLALLVAGLVAGGCDDSHNEVSSGLFLSPVAAGNKPKRVTVLAERLDFLRAIRPNATDEELGNIPTDPFVLGRISLHQPGNMVQVLDEYLVFETKTRSLLSVTRCGEMPSPLCSDVSLHYDSKGFDNAQDAFLGSAISPRVGSLKLQNGWILAFDPGNGNLIAFRKEAPRTIVINDIPREVKYRSSLSPDSKNFGAGNGLVLSVVVSGRELVDRLGFFQVAQFVEVSPTEILVLFSVNQDVQLIELREEEEFVPFDLATNPDSLFECNPIAEPTCLPVKFLRGAIRDFPGFGGTRPLVRESEILAVTGGTEAKLDRFHPLCLDRCQEIASGSASSPACDEVLVFDQVSSSFLTLDLERTDGKVSSAVVRMAANETEVRDALDGAAGPYEFASAFCNSQATEVFLFEGQSDTVIALNYEIPPSGNNVRFFIGPQEIRERRDPQGSRRSDTSGEIGLTFSSANARDNRIVYEDGSRELLSLNYNAGVVVLVLNPDDLEDATDFLSRGNFNFMDPDSADDKKLLVFDRQATSLLRIDLEYEALPVKIKN